MVRRHPRRRGSRHDRRTPWLQVRSVFGAALLCLGAAQAADAQTGSAAHNHGHPKTMNHEHGPGVTAEPLAPGADPVLLTGMGDHSMARASANSLAQAYFDQGLMLAYAFNHPEAAVAFRHAAGLDPECVLCPWGEALVLGPNINAAMEEGAVEPAWAALQEAMGRLDSGSSELERALVEALEKRYASKPVADRSSLDLAYADAMKDVAARFPEHADVQALFADALMTTMPWDYWLADGSPRPATEWVDQALHASLAADSRHPLANHLWIHMWEKNEPMKAVPAAERLEGLAPAAGHLVHMPAHIYIRVGRYADAVVANQRAIVADQAYLAQSGTEGLYRIGYVPHNVHFLWAAATLAGRSRTAIDAADRLAAQVDPALMATPGYDAILQDYAVTPLVARVRFGQWQEILDAPLFDDSLVYPRAMQAYARAVAAVRLGDEATAKAEVARAYEAASDPAMAEFKIWGVNSAADILAVAARVADAEIAAAEGRTSAAIELLNEAVTMEDGLLYQEPEAWHHPVRQVLGDMLLDAGRYEQAVEVFRQDLVKYPANGWSLWGMAEALRRSGQSERAAQVRAQFDAAFRDADIHLEGSRF